MIVLVVAVVAVTAVLLWRNRTFSEEADEEEFEDIRVTPLLRGINYLLSDQPDHALKEMVQVAKIRSESAEVYMALGEMFRAQGEYGRAVRIHQNLLARPDVPVELHFDAYVSLGRDFQAGGLLDRALRHYDKALAIKPNHLESLSACLRIREQSHEWDDAEWLVSRLEQIEGKSYHEHRAYLKAEMARAAFEKGDLNICESLVLEALKLSQSCTHAHLLLIESLIAEQKYDQALVQAKVYLEQVKPDHYSLLPKVLLTNQTFYQQYAEPFLLDAWQQYRDDELGVTWIENLEQYQGIEAVNALKEKLALHDLSLRHELRLLALDQADNNMVQQTKYWRLSMKHYACTQCGVQVHDMRWQCPKCNNWGSMEPLQTAQTFGEEEHA